MIDNIIVSLIANFKQITKYHSFASSPPKSLILELLIKYWETVFKRGLTLPPLKCRVINTDDLLEALSREHSSVLSTITPTLALAGQEITGAEFSYDLVWDLYQKKTFALITRGCKGAVVSDQFLYYGLSPDYFTYPVFHTHPSIENEQGLYQPSKADQKHLKELYKELGGRIPLVSLVLFPDRKYTIYGVNATDGQFIRPGLYFYN